MADFGYLSDTDDSAVEELVSQAKELSALEQVAAINCSGFTDSSLPDDLEARFRRLKSLPASRPDPVSSSSSSKHLAHSKSVASHPKGDMNFSGNRRNPGNISGLVSVSDEESSIFSGNKRDLDVKSGVDKISRDGSGDFSDSGNIGSSSSRESKIFKQNRKLLQEKRRIRSSSSSIDLASPPSSSPDPDTVKRLNPQSKSKPKPKSSSPWFDKLSPSKIIGFIWPSPTKSSTKKKKNIKSSKSFSAAYSSGRERDMDFDEFLSDLNAFSVEDQRKMLKKALKEQQKMRKEAAEIIKMTKKASAKFDFDD